MSNGVIYFRERFGLVHFFLCLAKLQYNYTMNYLVPPALFALIICCYFLVVQGVFFKFIYFPLSLGFIVYLFIFLLNKNGSSDRSTAIRKQDIITVIVIMFSIVTSYISLYLNDNTFIKYVMYALTLVNFGLFFVNMRRGDLILLGLNTFLLAIACLP